MICRYITKKFQIRISREEGREKHVEKEMKRRLLAFYHTIRFRFGYSCIAATVIFPQISQESNSWIESYNQLWKWTMGRKGKGLCFRLSLKEPTAFFFFALLT